MPNLPSYTLYARLLSLSFGRVITAMFLSLVGYIYSKQPLFVAIRARRPLSHYSDMAPKSRVVSSSSSTTPPTRPPESDIEILYNTAVQSFVRRDHGKTQAALARLLKHVEGLEVNQRAWYDVEVECSKEEEEGTEWRIKILKLVISANASLYSDPPSNVGTIPSDLAALLPPSSPDLMLGHIQSICTDTLSDTDLLPPAIISTLLLASLKLKPSPRALDFAHNLAESWIAGLPDALIHSISTNKVSAQSPQAKKRIEGCREGYLKVIELFVGEVLAREGDFEMARALLDGEEVMSSKRKEDLYRHLRSTETRLANSSSPSNSGILPPQSPSSSLLLPSATPTGSGQSSRSRSRSSTTSSSSSERTARPNANGINKSVGKNTHLDIPKNKGKEKESETVSVDSNSTFHFPDKIYINPSNPKSPTPPARRPLAQVQYNLASLLALIPTSIRKRLSYPILSVILPVPIITIFLLVWYIRRRTRQLRSVVGTASQVAVAVSTAGSVQERLQRARVLGMRAWTKHWLYWWWKKILGVWEMGTTITYV